jgi:dienelactone hydrolase
MSARFDLVIDSHGEQLAAWLYRPDGAGDRPVGVPCVVMAHGFSGTRADGLAPYAERFAAAGMAALVFDYRGFGDSSGQPRDVVDVGAQLDDWRAAIAHARTVPGIDPDKIALWGSSFSGGHVIEVAASDPGIAAVVAQVPFVDGLANLPRLGMANVARMTLVGLRDQLGALLGRPPHMLASVGPPGSLAVMTSPDAEPGFMALNPPGFEFRNEAAARIALRVGTYRPIKRAAAVRCPVFFAIADDDVVTPSDLADKAASRAPRAEVRHYPGGHFDPYVGELFDRVAGDEAEFLAHHLAPVAQAPSAASR